MAEQLLAELERATSSGARPLVGFATGSTYAPLFRALSAAGRAVFGDAVVTHLDEYLGFATDQRGGMVHELVHACPVFGDMLTEGGLLPVPSCPDAIPQHEEKLEDLGGVGLQFLGIGRNGHIAFNEPGCSPDAGFQVVDLSEVTRRDARHRFAPDPVPSRAVTAGIATILSARRLVLVATGAAKADSVARMLRGSIGSQCPASFIRRHPNALVVLDEAAARLLPPATASALGGSGGPG